MTKSTTTVRATPREFYEWLDGQMHFTVDVCANEQNHKHPRFFSPEDNGLAQTWEGETFFMNPPYGREIVEWMKKARDSAILDNAMGACLVPARVDTEWWRLCVLQQDPKVAAGRLRSVHFDTDSLVHWYRWDRINIGVYFHDERIAFDGMETGAPFPAAVVFMGAPRRRPIAPQLLSTLPSDRDWPLLVAQWP